MSARIPVAMRVAVALGAAVMLGACESGSEDSVQAGAESLIAANPTISGLSDPNIFATMDAINVLDSASGAIAATKATDPEVRQYAQMMVADHHDMREEGRALAARLNITPEAPPNDQSEANQSAVIASLQQTERGKAFDRTYMAHAVRTHESALATARNAASSTRHPEVRTYTQNAIPVIERHLNRAREIQQRIGGGDTTAAADTGRRP